MKALVKNAICVFCPELPVVIVLIVVLRFAESFAL